jgi:iron complex outermembrane receptor protein
LQDTPIAITAVTADLLEARSQTNIAEIANQAPSVTLRPATGAFGNSMSASIRGFGQIDFNPQLEPGVGLYIDDVYYPRLTGANFDLMDVERIEILRGPQGTLTGRNSEGGAIRFISKQPTGDGSGYVEATYGTRNRVSIRAGADFALADKWSARISGTFKEQKGYVNVLDYGCANPGSGILSAAPGSDCIVGQYGNTSYQAVRGVLRFQPTNAIDLTLSADYTKDSSNNPAEVLLYARNSNPNVQTVEGIPFDSRFICGKFCNYAETGSEAGTFVAGAIPALNGLPMAATTDKFGQNFEGWGVALNSKIDLADTVKLVSVTAYREFTNHFNVDTDLSPARTGFGVNDVISDFFSQELRLNFDFGDLVQATFGAYYSNENTAYNTIQDLRYVAAGSAPLFPLQFLGRNPVKTDSKAVFGTVIVKPADLLTITLGARYTDERKSTKFGRLNFDGSINAFLDPVGAAYGAGYAGADTLDTDRDGNLTEIVTALNGYVGKYHGSRVDYRIAVDYRFSDAILAYANFATGFKGGGISPRPFNAAQVQPFGPEQLKSYEVGVKTDLLNKRVRVNIAAFYNDFSNAQLTLLSCPQFGGPGPCALPQNAGDATVKGIEVEMTAEPVDNFDINASFSALSYRYDCVNIQVVRPLAVGETNVCSTNPAIVDALATPPRGVGDLQWSVGAQYMIDLGNSGSFTPRVDVIRQSSLNAQDSVPAAGSPSALFGRIPSYTLTNGRVTWRNAGKNLSISFEVTNMFDKYYYNNIFDLTGPGAGVISGSVGRPREWAVSVKRAF